MTFPEAQIGTTFPLLKMERGNGERERGRLHDRRSQKGCLETSFGNEWSEKSKAGKSQREDRWEAFNGPLTFGA